MSFGLSVGDISTTILITNELLKVDELRIPGQDSPIDILAHLKEVLVRFRNARPHNSSYQVQYNAFLEVSSQCQTALEQFRNCGRLQNKSNGRNWSAISRVEGPSATWSPKFLTAFKAEITGHLLSLIMIDNLNSNLVPKNTQQSLATLDQFTLQNVQEMTTPIAQSIYGFDNRNTLMDRTMKIITTNLRIYNAVVKLQLRGVPSQVKLRQPVILNDALGRRAPFHLEYVTSHRVSGNTARLSATESSSGSRTRHGFDLDNSEYIEEYGLNYPGLDKNKAAAAEFLTSGNALTKLGQKIRKSLYFNSDPHAKFWLVDQEIMEGFHTLCSFRDEEPDQRYTATFKVFWELWQFLQEELDGSKDLSPVITLSGSAVYARASQCGVYLQENWGKLGLDLLNAIETVLKSTDLRSSRYYPDGSFSTAAMDVLVEIHPSRSPDEKEHAVIRVYGSLDTLKQVGYCLTWLTAAIRISPYGQMSYSDAILTDRSYLAPFSADPEIRNSMYFEIYRQELQPLSKEEQKMCWIPLFSHSVIADGFPIPKRENIPGVEISFDIMTTLSGASYPVDYSGGIVLQGLSTMLVPTRLESEDSLQWHFIAKPRGNRITLKDIDENCSEIYPATDLSSLQSRRAFLGWSKEANIYLGTKEMNYADMSFSRAITPTPRIELSGFSVGLGSSVIGQGGPTAVANFTMSKRRRNEYSQQREEDFEFELRKTKDMPILLYDPSSRRAWLVSTLSVILHLAHIYAHIFPSRVTLDNKRIPLPYAEPSSDGGAAALKTILDNHALVIYQSSITKQTKTFLDLIREIYFSLMLVVDKDSARPPAAKTSIRRREVLSGWELKAIVETPQFPQDKECLLLPSSGGWFEVSSSVLVLFCDGLGEVIRPCESGRRNFLCERWRGVPTGKDYLAASVEMLMVLSERCGFGDSCEMVGPGVVWERGDEIGEQGGIFADCRHGAGGGKCYRPLQKLRRIKPARMFSRSRDRERGRSRAGSRPGVMVASGDGMGAGRGRGSPNGAVIFGKRSTGLPKLSVNITISRGSGDEAERGALGIQSSSAVRDTRITTRRNGEYPPGVREFYSSSESDSDETATLRDTGGDIRSSGRELTGTKVQADWGPLLQKLEGHSASVNSVAFSSDGQLIISGSSDQTIRFWDAITGALLQVIKGHSGSVSSVAISPDCRQVASASVDRTIKLWNTATGAALQILEGHSGSVSSVTFSPDGQILASVSADQTLRLWDAITGALLQILAGHSGPVSSAAFSPDGQILASVSADQTLRIWDVTTGALLQTLQGHSGSISSVAFSPDRQILATASADQSLRLWDVTTGVLLQILEGHSGSVSSVAFSPDKRQIVSASADSTIRLWDVSTGTTLQTLKGHSDVVCMVVFSPDGRNLASASEDMSINLWDPMMASASQTSDGGFKHSLIPIPRSIDKGLSSLDREDSNESTEPRVKPHGPFSDSGYASMPFPTAPSSSNDATRASIHTNQDTKQLAASCNDQDDNQNLENHYRPEVETPEAADNDAHSIISDRDEIFSQVPARRSHQELLAERHLTLLLAQHQDLTPLYDIALERMEREHFVDNFRKILKRYYLDLVQSASTNLEHATIHLLRSRWRRVRIAQDIVDQASPKSNEINDYLVGDMQEAEAKMLELESWIAGNPGLAPPAEPHNIRGEVEVKADDFDDAVSDRDSEEEENIKDYLSPNVVEMEKFLLEGNSFHLLVTNICLFLLPASLTSLSRVLMTVPYNDIYFSSEEYISVLNRVKGFLEDHTEENWNWWPLQPRVRPLARALRQYPVGRYLAITSRVVSTDTATQ
ncbi:hypothetical protein ACEPPN_011009 [Leptodophora sp. 'Broadleaf-Isolate-01']